MTIKIPARNLVLTLLATLASLSPGHSQTTWDDGGAPDQNWSTFANWSTDASPAGTAVVFGNTGTTPNATTVGNIVDQDFVISSLAYSNSFSSTTRWQVTQIAAGSTLTVAGSDASFLVGGYTTGTITQAAITGADGTFVVNQSTGTFAVGNAGANAARALLDMSGLGSFEATVNAFTVGAGTTGYGSVILSDASTITASSLTTGGVGSGYSNGGTPSNIIQFGANTALNIDTIKFFSGRTVGQAFFRSGVSNGMVKIRARDGVSRALLSVADISEGGTYNPSGPNVSSLDFSGGAVDALLSSLTVGYAQRGINGSNSYTGRMIMTSGTLDATSVVVGRMSGNDGNAAASLIGNLQIAGGNFIAGSVLIATSSNSANNSVIGVLDVSGSANVQIIGDLTIGLRSTPASVHTLSGTVNMTAGTLLINGNLTEGTGGNIDSAVNLSGGMLNLDHGDIAVDSFAFTGGTLQDVSSFTAETTGGLNVQNDATLAFGLDSSFISMTLTGTLGLGADSNLGLTLADGYDPGIGFTLVNNDGGDLITGTFATINGAAFGAGDTFTLTNNLGSFQYELSYLGGDGNDLVALAVPEPSAGLLMAAGLFSLLLRRRRTKHFPAA